MKDIKCERIAAREVYDGRGRPALEVRVRLSDGSDGRATVPSGEPGEARPTVELRDGDPRRYAGRGLRKAVRGVTSIIGPAMAGSCPGTQREADHLLGELDSTPDGSRLGANTLLGVSLAWAKALAAHYGMSLYRFLGGEATGRLPVPWMPLPAGAWRVFLTPTGASSLEEGVRWCTEVLGRLDPTGTPGPEQQLARAADAIEGAGHAGRIALGVWPRGLWEPGKPGVTLPGAREAIPAEETVGYWETLCHRYPLGEVIDPVAPEEGLAWGELAARLPAPVRLGASAALRGGGEALLRALEDRCFHDVVICLHHAKTVTGLLEEGDRIRESGAGLIIGAAPGETEEDAPADLALALGARQMIPGGGSTGLGWGRINRLLELEREC